jgi:hypothetical protein
LLLNMPPEASTTDLPTQPVFVPLMQRVFGHVARRPFPNLPEVVVGEGLVLTPPAGATGPQCRQDRPPVIGRRRVGIPIATHELQPIRRIGDAGVGTEARRLFHGDRPRPAMQDGVNIRSSTLNVRRSTFCTRRASPPANGHSIGPFVPSYPPRIGL